ncbi:kinesin-like protein [Scheffersomyces xylosifermentans]|uniref:kinesin-like protein n=1 Tax=Scheffersomyces xylosifermentans TaxID=1304137 RepID=UPI00315CBE1B
MIPRTRKTQAVDLSANAVGNANGSGASISNDSYSEFPTTGGNSVLNQQSSSSYANPTIPANKGGKRYTMSEVFDVWYANKDQIVNPSVELPVLSNENYKLARPRQIYHLDLQPNTTSTGNQNSTSDLDGGYSASNEVNAFKASENSNVSSVSNSNTNSNTNNSTSNIPSLEQSLGNFSLQEPVSASSGVSGNQYSVERSDISQPSANVVQGPPPGMAAPSSQQVSNASAVSPHPILITSDKIEWFYIDPLGTEQGPFNGDLMQDWLTGGYLHLDLKIRRKEETSYRTLKELCDSVQNYMQPFKIPLLDLSVPQPVPVPPFGSQSSLQQFSGLAQQQQQQQQPQQPQQSSQFHPLLSNGPGNHLGRLNSSLNQQSTIFGSDFIGNDPFSSGPAGAFQSPGGPNQFGIDAMNHQNLQQNLGFNSGLQLNTMPSLLQQQIQQQQHQPVLSRTNSGWGGLDSSSSLHGGATPVSVAPVLPSQISQPAPMSPWLSGIPSSSRISSPFVPVSTLSGSSNVGSAETKDTPVESAVTHEDHVLDNHIHSSVVTGILNDGDEDHFKPEVVAPPAQPEVKPAEKVIPEQQLEQPQPQEVEVDQQEQQEETEPEIEHTTPVVENLKPAVPSQQELAPWATAKQETEQKPTLTLKEIQQLEAERLEKQKKLQAQQRQEQAAKNWSQVEEATPEKIPALPKTSSWAAAPAPVVSKKTLAEIQKEEAEAAAARARAAKAVAASTGTPVQKSSFASALANSVPKDDSPWQTVAVKKPVLKKSTTAPTITNATSSARTNPQLLRSVSATRPAVAGVNANALREEFLIWARSNMTNLYPTVSKDDLLDIFITLPVASSDSSSLIAETIYSSSATMDGRRFAQEFLKRRQKVDQQIGSNADDLSWSSAIISSADKVSTVDEDGWSTSIKSKKNKNKKF